MIGKLFDSLIEHLIDLITTGFDIVIMACQNIFSINLTIFESVFPGAKSLYTAILGASIGLVIVIFLIQILKCLNPTQQDYENPGQLLIRSFLALFLVMFARQFLGILLAYGNTLFADLQGVKLKTASKNTHLASKTYNAIVKAFKADNAVSQAFQDVNGVGIVIRVIAIIFSIYVVYTLCKLVAYGIKNYILLGFFGSLICLPAACIASKSTEGIFKRYLGVLIGQIMILYLNLWFWRVGMEAVTHIHAPKISSISAGKIGEIFGRSGVITGGFSAPVADKFTSFSSAIVWCLMIGYFFQIGLSTSQYVRELGIGVSGVAGRSFIGKVANGINNGVRAARSVTGIRHGLAKGFSSTGAGTDDKGNSGSKKNPFPGKKSGSRDDKHNYGSKKNLFFDGKSGFNNGDGSPSDEKKGGKNEEMSKGYSNQEAAPLGEDRANWDPTGINRGSGKSSPTADNQYLGPNRNQGNGKNDIFDPKSLIHAGVRKSLNQKLKGNAARNSLMGALGPSGQVVPIPNTSDGVDILSNNGTKLASFRDISSDGQGGIHGNFDGESVEMVSQERFAEMQAEGVNTIGSDFHSEDYQKIYFGGEELYVNQASAPKFSSMMQSIYDEI